MDASIVFVSSRPGAVSVTPLPVVTADSTRADVSAVIPWRLKLFASRSAISRSVDGSSWSAISRIVTRLPKALYQYANSAPTAPPPITATDAGHSVERIASSLCMIILPSKGTPGRARGSVPVARITRSLAISTLPPAASGRSTSTRVGPVSRAEPGKV
jgi:hypothetical protein